MQKKKVLLQDATIALQIVVIEESAPQQIALLDQMLSRLDGMRLSTKILVGVALISVPLSLIAWSM